MPGREKYKGIIHHSAKWDAAKEAADGVSYAGKQVGVIGMVGPTQRALRVAR